VAGVTSRSSSRVRGFTAVTGLTYRVSDAVHLGTRLQTRERTTSASRADSRGKWVERGSDIGGFALRSFGEFVPVELARTGVATTRTVKAHTRLLGGLLTVDYSL
jgi:hypothetical protein